MLRRTVSAAQDFAQSDEPLRAEYDAVVVGSGPNGLTAAVCLALAGKQVCVIEAAPTIGGGLRTHTATLPGFQHDQCAAVFPLGVASPYLRALPLEEHGLTWVHPDAPLGHSFVDSPALLAERSLDATSAALGQEGNGWRKSFARFAEHSDELLPDLLAPLHPRLLLRRPSRTLQSARFGLGAMRSAQAYARSQLTGPRSRALFAGIAAHSILPLERAGSAAAGLMLGHTLHARGWPSARGGSQSIADALARLFVAEGGEIVVGHRVERL